MIPLRHWPEIMRNQTNASLYSQRKTIAEEYEVLQRNDNVMKEIYGSNLDSVVKLVKAIGDQNTLRNSGRKVAQQLSTEQSSRE